MTPIGAFTFVLHSHIPYVRMAGRWPHGEEWLHEAAAETYIPLLRVLYDLQAESIPFHITIGITPILAEQLVDRDVQAHFDLYLAEKIAVAEQDIGYYSAPETANPHLQRLAQWYKTWYSDIQSAFNNRFGRDIIGAFRHLQDTGDIEIITCAATHGYLPLLSRDSSVFAQIKIGVESYKRLFGRAPRAIWLPECAYRPAYITEEGEKRPGLETFLAENDLKLFFSETHAVTGGQPVGIAAGDIIGPYGAIKRKYVIPAELTKTKPASAQTTYESYYVRETVFGADAPNHNDVKVIGRNNRTGEQVWSAQSGYPGDSDYREFHRKSGTSGLQYWRVTGQQVDLGSKDYYYPQWAQMKIEQHAEHFSHLVADLLREQNKANGQFGLIASNYDTELFGHWWWEGVAWLGQVLRHIASDPDVQMLSASDYSEQHPPRLVVDLPESSWGSNGSHFTWDNPDTHWMWEPIHEAEVRMEGLVDLFPNPSDEERNALNQAARELLLLQSSDWLFLVTTSQAREYSIRRFSQHLERFEQLAGLLENNQATSALVAELWEQDKLFPDMNYRWFAAR